VELVAIVLSDGELDQRRLVGNADRLAIPGAAAERAMSLRLA